MASPEFLDHFQSPRGQGGLAEPTHTGQAQDPVCGDVLELDLRVQAGRVMEARFRVRGCAGSIAAGSALCEWLPGSVASVPPDLREQLNTRLGGVPAGRGHALDLAICALRSALTAKP